MSENQIEAKRQIIGDLFSIRAGMSYISQLSNRYSDKKNEIQSIHKSNTSIANSTSSLRNDISKQSGMADEFRQEKEQHQRELVEKRKKLENLKNQAAWRYYKMQCKGENWDRKFYGNDYIKWSIGIAVAILIFLAVTGGVVYGMSRLRDSVANVELLLVLIIPIAALIFSCVKFAKVKKHVEMYHNKAIEKISNEIAAEEQEVARLDSKYNEAVRNSPGRAANDEKKIQSNDMRIAQNKQAIAKLENEAKRLVMEANGVYKALVAEYGEFFHPENWKNLDRVVYYLNTGRADNLRDALNLMDQRLNAEMIANEIRQSSSMIAGEIQRANQNTVLAMTQCAARLNSAINAMGAQISASNRAVADQIGASNQIAYAQVSATRQLVSEQQLGNALQAKANSSMEQMLADYRVVNNRVQY